MKIGLTQEYPGLREALEASGHEVVLLSRRLNRAGIYEVHHSARDLDVDAVFLSPLFDGDKGYHRKLLPWAGGNIKKPKYVFALDADGRDALKQRGCIMRMGQCFVVVSLTEERAVMNQRLMRTILWSPGQPLDFQPLFSGRAYGGGKRGKYYDNLGRAR